MATQTLAIIVAITGIASNIIMWGVMIWKVGRWTASTESSVVHIGEELQRQEKLIVGKADLDDLLRIERTVNDARDRWHQAIQGFSQQVTTMALSQAAIVPQIDGISRRLANIETMLLQYGGERRVPGRLPDQKPEDRG